MEFVVILIYPKRKGQKIKIITTLSGEEKKENIDKLTTKVLMWKYCCTTQELFMRRLSLSTVGLIQ